MRPEKINEPSERLTIAPATLLDSTLDAARLQFERQTRFLPLFLAHERRIHGFILTLVPSWSDADDLLQETSAVMWRKLDEFENGTDFAAWALTIARYQVLNYRKKQRRDRVVFSDETVEALADQMASMSPRHGEDSPDALEQCLAKLRSGDGDLIRWRYQPGATTQEVAERADRSIRAVYKALNRIHGQLLHCIRRSLIEGRLS
jgi:RNA polymerase sigma-70 factor (ECF subfamily)